jgi:hypothetical protein
MSEVVCNNYDSNSARRLSLISNESTACTNDTRDADTQLAKENNLNNLHDDRIFWERLVKELGSMSALLPMPPLSP